MLGVWENTSILSTQKRRRANSTREGNLYKIKGSSLKRHGLRNRRRSKGKFWCIFPLAYGCKNTHSLKEHYLHVPLPFRFINPCGIDAFLCGVINWEKIPGPQDVTLKVRLKLYAYNKGVLPESQWFVFLCIRIKFWYLKGSEELALPLGKRTNSKSLSYIFFF